MIPQIIGAGLQAYNMYNSWQDKKKAEAAAAELDRQPVPQYTPNSRLNSFYQQAVAGVANPQGYTGAETAGYNSRLAQIMASRNANAQNMAGGQLSRAIGGMGNAESINALNQFSGNDAALRRSAFNAAMGRQQSAMGQYQSLDNMNTQTALQRRLMKEQGLGQAIQSNKAMISNSLNNLGGDLMGYGMTKDLMADRLKLAGAGAGAGNTGGAYSPDLYSTYLGTGSKMGLGNRFNNYVEPYNDGGFSGIDNTNKQYNFITGKYE
jgi:hypothetical protein